MSDKEDTGLGLMSVGVKAGGMDDAIHIVRNAGDELTLCQQAAAERNVDTFAPDMMVDGMGGCWTCNDVAHRLATTGKRDST